MASCQGDPSRGSGEPPCGLQVRTPSLLSGRQIRPVAAGPWGAQTLLEFSETPALVRDRTLPSHRLAGGRPP